MSVAATPVPLSEAKARLSELARRVRQQHERIILTRNGEPEAVLLSVDDLEGLEMTWKSSVTPRRWRASGTAWPVWSAVSLAPTWLPFAGT
jgi:prevent-host-death family protein